MKKNKTIAYLMAATLLVGGTFLGTKALFTDQEDVVGAVTITTGDVDLKVIEDQQDWTLVRNGDDNGANGEGGRFENLKFGDKLTRKVTIKNEGSLNAIVNIEPNTSKIDTTTIKENHKGTVINGIQYTAKLRDGEAIGSNIRMTPNQEIQLDLEIEVVGKGKHNADGSLNNSEIQGIDINLENSFVVNAKQVEK